MRSFNRFYQGPKSRLVWLNLLISFIALIPVLIEASLWALTTSRVNWGEAGVMFMGVSVAILWMIGQTG